MKLTEQPFPDWARTLGQEYSHLSQIHASKRGKSTGRLAPRESKLEAQLFHIEVGGGKDVADRQGWVELLAFDEWDGGSVHENREYQTPPVRVGIHVQAEVGRVH